MSSVPLRTLAVYQRDSTIRELAAKITSCNLISSLSESERGLFKSANDDDYVLTTDQTIFHAQGGGQPSDTGVMTGVAEEDKHSKGHADADNDPPKFQVKLVRKLPDERILHHGIFSPNPKDIANSTPYQPGTTILQKINSAKRDYHSRLHTAGHLLSLAVRQLSTQYEKEGRPPILPADFKEGKANHAPGSAFVEFHGLIASEHKAAIEKETNELVKQDLEVKVSWMDEEKARAVCVDVPELVHTGQDEHGEETEAVRVVEVVGVGAYPCGGTHLATTALVGEVVVRNIKRQKGVTKISYALKDDMPAEALA